MVDGSPAPSGRTAARSARPTALNAASATWCASRPDASTLIEARAACAKLASMCVAIPGSSSSFSSAFGTPAEVDRRSRERVVHRHDRVAVARDPAPVAERGVERRAERERRVLGGVVVAGLEVAGAFEDEVEAGVERELLEKVVVEAGAGGDAHAARAVEREAHGDPRLGGRAQRAGAPPAARQRPARAGRATRASASTSRSSSGASSTETRIASGIGAHDDALAQQRLVEREPVVDRDVEEVRVRLERREPERAQACREPLALLEHRRRVGPLGERCDRERRGQRRDRGRRLAGVQLVRRLARGERVADARAGEPEELRERAQDDHAVVEQVERRHAAVLEVRLVDDERAARRAAARARRSGCSAGTRR